MRLIAGRFRGRRIDAPKGLATRPTTDRVREALFQILGDLSGERVVDLYAGSGALGFEALSRGAEHVTFVESDRAAVRMIRTNAERLGVGDQTAVISKRVERAGAALEELAPFDLVLSDPPWPISQNAAEAALATLEGMVSQGGRVVLGHRHKEPVALPPEAAWSLIERRRWGDSGMSLFESS